MLAPLRKSADESFFTHPERPLTARKTLFERKWKVRNDCKRKPDALIIIKNSELTYAENLR